MRYHWLEDRIDQKQIQLIWKRGKYNWADYFTKHHPPAYHHIMRKKYLIQCVTSCLAAQTRDYEGVLLSSPQSGIRQVPTQHR
jgi:hypothetical protein